MSLSSPQSWWRDWYGYGLATHYVITLMYAPLLMSVQARVEEKRAAADELLAQMGKQRGEAEQQQLLANQEQAKADEVRANRPLFVVESVVCVCVCVCFRLLVRLPTWSKKPTRSLLWRNPLWRPQRPQ